MHHIHFGIVLQ